MKILIIGPIEKRCPPVGYGGSELILWFLARRLHLMGHEVHLMVRYDSIAVCTQIYPVFKRNIVEVFNQHKINIERFDVIHDKIAKHEIANMFPDAPFVTTEHGTRLPDGPQPCGISQDQVLRWGIPNAPFFYNGIDPEFYRYCDHKEDYVLYLGSVQQIKGVVDWLKVMQDLPYSGIIAGQAHESHCPGYWVNECLPLMRKNIVRVDEVKGHVKADLFAKARCFMFLPRVREAFGTVVIEALVSGTPVVTWDYGPMKEIVEDGVSGFVVPYGDHEAAKEAVKECSKLEPFNCYLRGKKFDDINMANMHLDVYNQVKNGIRW